MCCLRWRIVHMNRALSSGGRGCLSATFSRPIPICFSDELLVWWLWVLIFTFLVLALKKKKTFKPSCFSKWDCWMRERVCRSGHPQGVWGFKKSRKEALSPKENTKQGQRLLEKANERLSRKRHPPSPFAQLLLLQELGWRLRSRSMVWTAPRA